MPPREPYKKYNRESLEKAVETVKNGGALRATAKQFKIPFATLQSRVSGKYPIDTKPGPDPYLGVQEEKDLVDWVIQMSRCGFPITKEQLFDAVQLVITKMEKKTPFHDGRPSKTWYQSFLRRNKELSEKMSQNLTKRRALVSKEEIKNWFDCVKDYLASRNLLNIDPRRIFNLDESAFLLSPTSKVLVHKRDKAAYTLCSNDKECYTALVTGNAAGELLPTMVVYPYQTIPAKLAKLFPDDFVIGKSESGWMTSETFYMFIVNIFLPWCIKNGIKFPVILFVDGHSSHLTIELSNFCLENLIELVSLYANSTHILQPMDVAVFKALKAAYKKMVQKWRQENDLQPLTKYHFAEVLKNAIDSLKMDKILQSGFKACGLYPFNPDIVSYEKLFNEGCDIDFGERNVTKINQDIDMAPIEKGIDSTVLKFFKANNDSDVWSGPAEFKELYHFWLDKKRSLQLSQNEINTINETTPNQISENLVNQETNKTPIQISENLINQDISKNDNLNTLHSNDVILAEIILDNNDSHSTNEINEHECKYTI